MKDSEGINQRTFMHSPGTQTMIWGLAGGGQRVELGRRREREKKQEQLLTASTTKIKLRKKKCFQ